MFLKMCPAHRDKAEIKCMGPVDGKHQQNQKYISSSLSLSIGSKTKMMGHLKLLSDQIAQPYGKIIYLCICLFLYIVPKIECAPF